MMIQNMLLNTAVQGQVLSEGYDPGITPDGSAPWMGMLNQIAGWVLASCIVALVVVLAVGIIMWIGGKLGSHGGAQKVGVTILLWGVIAAVAIGSLSGLIFWATRQSLV